MTLRFTRMPAEGPITGRFGDWYENERGVYRHRGVDIGCPIGTPVYAPAAGRVVEPTNDGSFGIAVCLDHPGTPWFSLYAHLSHSRVKAGDEVMAGQQIGLSGDTGFVLGAHLHWQVCKTTTFPLDINQSADPLSFFAQEEEEMLDPRVDLIVKALTGLDPGLAADLRIAEWNRTGNSLLQGFANEQIRVGLLEARMEAVEEGLAGEEAGFAFPDRVTLQTPNGDFELPAAQKGLSG